VRVVLDPNVLISALISPQGPSAEILDAWIAARFELVVSEKLLAELDDVLDRPKFRRWVAEIDGREFVAGLGRSATVVVDPPAPARLSPDPDDDYLIELAQTVGADYLVSGDRHLTELVDPSTPIVTPRDFLDALPHPS
jgi:putative PIN family toxin of toxin-antitoxin system